MESAVDFDTIYAQDLVYVPGCWQLCGNANCCSFSRQKDRFRLVGSAGAQELPLLPGEFAYLQARDLLGQFGDYQHRVAEYRFGARVLPIESLISRNAGCACAHATRTTVCRLYPFLPVFDLDRAVVGVERLGIYEVLEDLAGEGRICQVDTIPEVERVKFAAIAGAIGADPLAAFYVDAYRIAQNHTRRRLLELKGDRQADIYSVFEMAVQRQRLIDHAALGAELEAHASALEERHGVLGLAA
ncbi:MAG: hypothetical protein B7Y80_04280 [Hyphomicrobium sp. 32-62-53]|nr:MAG: hypothetical protein B7Z29_05990 [Hyphomicrobium sp. 12-62-95]OYY01125.1 MAG: hypothetical protein B7Y80_04280 [Hyphomicrobium sp. 32-62-53]